MSTKKTSKVNETKKTEKKKTVTKKTEVKTIAPTVEELQKQIAELTARLNAQPKSIEEQIEFFKTKKKKIDYLNLFEKKQKEVCEVIQVLEDQISSNDLEETKYILKLERYSQYSRGDKVLSVNNPEIVNRCFGFLNDCISQRITELRNDIQA